MTPQTHQQQRRARMAREAYGIVSHHQRKQQDNAVRSQALNRLTLQAEGGRVQRWLNSAEVIICVLILAVVEILRTEGVL